MKKVLLLLLLFGAARFAVQGQTWFSAAADTITSTAYVLPATVRLSDHSFISIWPSDGDLRVDKYNDQGSMISSLRAIGTVPRFGSVAGAELMDGESAILLYGKVYPDPLSSAVVSYYLARLDLYTNEIRTAYCDTSYVPDYYMNEPDVFITDNEIYAVFPSAHSTVAASFDHDLNARWCKGLMTSGIDPDYSKHPSLGCVFTDGALFISCKHETPLALMKLSSDGDFLGYRLSSSTYTRICNMSKAQNGDLLLGGRNGTVPLVIRMKTDGTVLWSKILTGYSETVVDIQELPDGRIVAFAQYDIPYQMFFQAAYILDANGNPVSRHALGNYTTHKKYRNAHVYPDGILASGNTSLPGSSVDQNLYQFTDFDFSQSCLAITSTPVFTNYDPGTWTDVPDTGFTMWDIAPPYVHGSVTLLAGGHQSTSFCSFVTGVDPTSSATSVTAYPNPVNAGESLNLKFTSASQYTITLLDITGKVILTKSVTGTQATLQPGDIAPGVYTLIVRDAAVQVSTQKIMVK